MRKSLRNLIFYNLALVFLISGCHKSSEDCIDDVVKNSKTEQGVTVGVGNCYTKNKNLNNKEPSKPEVAIVEDCSLTWNGEKFIRGIPLDSTKYLTVGFPNTTTLAYIPLSMSKEIGGKVIESNWAEMKNICPALKISELK